MAALDFIKNLFRPTWRNTDPEVRAESVRQMDQADEHDARKLAQIARGDDDVRVRRIAVKKLVDPDVLADLAGTESDESLRKVLTEKLQDVLIANAVSDGNEGRATQAVARLASPRALADVARDAAHESVRRAAVQKIGDGKALLDVARNGRDSATRLAAVARISDAALLRELAIHEPGKEIGLAALERISDDAELQAVLKRAKNKTVREAARERLGLGPASGGALGDDRSPSKNRGPATESTVASPEARRRARSVQLCITVEKIAVVSDFEAAADELAEAERSWADVGGSDADFQKRFDRAVQRFHARKAARDEAAAAQERARRAEVEALEKRVALAAGVEALDGEDLPKRVEAAKAEWKAAGSVPAEKHAELEQRFARAVESALRRHEQGKSRATIRARQEAIVAEVEAFEAPERREQAEKKLPSLAREWRELSASAAADDALAQRYAAVTDRITARIAAVRAEDKAREDAEHAHNLARLQELCGQLEALVESEDRKTVESTLKVAQAAFESTGPVGKEQHAEVRRRFQAARDKLVGRMQDLRDAEHWKRWANVPRLEALVAKVEALRDDAAVEVKDLGPALKALQSEWRKVGPCPKEKSEALWARFKEAGDQIFKRMGEHLETTDEQRAENLAKKEALCVEVAALADTPVETMNWKETAEKIKAAQEQWKTIGAVPKEQADAIWKRFRESCDKFFGQRKEHHGKVGEERGENLKKKEELIAQAETLASAIGPSVNWKETADQLKALQEEWKSVGPVAKEHADAVWKRFREACDKFFERRKEHFGRLDEERAANLKKKEDLIAQVEAIVANPDALEGKGREQAVTQVKQLQAQWKKTGPAPKEQADAIWKRFRDGCDKFFKPVEEEVYEEPAAAAAPDPAKPEGISRFVNRLPLEGLLRKDADAPASDASAATPDAHPEHYPADGAKEHVVDGAPAQAPDK